MPLWQQVLHILRQDEALEGGSQGTLVGTLLRGTTCLLLLPIPATGPTDTYTQWQCDKIAKVEGIQVGIVYTSLNPSVPLLLKGSSPNCFELDWGQTVFRGRCGSDHGTARTLTKLDTSGPFVQLFS